MEDVLQEIMPEPAGPQARVIEAMRYATLEGGKRIRAFLVLQAGRLFGVDRRALSRVAAAIECVHAYSLVHDDLPSMDNDDMRRGRPATHIKFDEATAILAGDALLTHAFALLAAHETHPDPHVRSDLVLRLAQSSGFGGMVGGQMIDIGAKGTLDDIGQITRMQRLKTGALITFACEAGAIMGKASTQMRHALTNYAQDLGLAYQITDDLLDVEGDPAVMGKAARKDQKAGKATFVTILGSERARAQAEMLANQAAAHLDVFDEKADLLRGLVSFVVNRRA
ncbi:MAG: farnesyl diphosphate synthase [Alphaproteobacteria bacterium]|nr:farnesyl diphosphate synthase [Alphaproteobacteria bacterium]